MTDVVAAGNVPYWLAPVMAANRRSLQVRGELGLGQVRTTLMMGSGSTRISSGSFTPGTEMGSRRCFEQAMPPSKRL